MREVGIRVTQAFLEITRASDQGRSSPNAVGNCRGVIVVIRSIPVAMHECKSLRFKERMMGADDES